MKRLIIICEGPTEFQFCQEILYNHFLSKGIFIQCPYPKWSHGGQIAWRPLFDQISAHLHNDKSAYVTTFIDLYGLHSPSLFPRWNEALALKHLPYERVQLLEEAMKNQLPDDIRYRFIPNFVLHEFEGLLFNNIQFFMDYFDPSDFKDLNELKTVFRDFSNPELINETLETSPSHRLDGKIFHSFKKTLHGIDIAKNIGLKNMRIKSLHFNEWIQKLESINPNL